MWAHGVKFQMRVGILSFVQFNWYLKQSQQSVVIMFIVAMVIIAIVVIVIIIIIICGLILKTRKPLIL